MAKRCPNCEKHVEALSNFCKHCGHDIESFGKKLDKKCPGCKALVDPVAKFCRHCGEGLHTLAKMGPFGLLVTVAILTAIVIMGAFVVYGLTTKVPYTVTVPYTTLETYEEVVPIVTENCQPESLVKERMTFRVQQNYLATQGFGSISRKFPKKVNRCSIEGTWKTDNRRPQRRYCNGMTGSFSGEASKSTQYVVIDANAFDWRGIQPGKLYDPPEERINGFSIYTHLCDIRGYENKKHYARGKLTGFGTDTLTLDWQYFDQDTRPAVDFFIDLTCEVGRESCITTSQDKVVERQREITKYKEETRYRLLIQDWFSR